MARKKSMEARVLDLSLRLMQSIAKTSGPLPTPKPGIYRNVPMDVYHRWDAVSNSRLGLLDRSPAHLMESIRNPKPSTPAQVLGTITHCAVLEAPLFDLRYVVGPEGDRRTKDVKAAWEALEKTYGEDYVLTTKEMRVAQGVRKSISEKTRATALLTGPGLNELSIVWDDPETGLRCKARLDRISPFLKGGTIADLKSTVDARKRAFAKALYRFGYHRQGGFYIPGAKAVGLEVEHYTIIAYEKEPPFPVAIYRLDQGTIDAGEFEARRLLRLYAECKEKNEWPTAPSYPDTIEDIAIPSWAFEMVDTGEEYGA